MAADLIVTISAIQGYLAKTHEAQEQFEEASKIMQQAAQDLCSNWEGEAAQAFAREQNVFAGWCGEMDKVGLDFMQVLETAIDTYLKADDVIKNLIGSN